MFIIFITTFTVLLVIGFLRCINKQKKRRTELLKAELSKVKKETVNQSENDFLKSLDDDPRYKGKTSYKFNGYALEGDSIESARYISGFSQNYGKSYLEMNEEERRSFERLVIMSFGEFLFKDEKGDFEYNIYIEKVNKASMQP